MDAVLIDIAIAAAGASLGLTLYVSILLAVYARRPMRRRSVIPEVPERLDIQA